MRKEGSCKYGDRYVSTKKVGKYRLSIVIIFSLILYLLVSLIANNNETSKDKKDVITFTEKTTVKVATLKSAGSIEVEVEHTETIPAQKILADNEPGELEIKKLDTTTSAVTPIVYYTEDDVIMIAKLLTNEAGGVRSLTQKSAVAWVVLNRVASSKYPNTIVGVITQPYQFEGWHPETEPYDECIKLARDVLELWNMEMNGSKEGVGRTIPEEYLYFTGDGVNNYFTTTQYGDPYVFGSRLISPYKN